MKVFRLIFLLTISCSISAKTTIASKLISNKEVWLQLSKVAESTKPTLPKKIDKNTILFDMKPFGLRGLEYSYKLNMTKEALLKIPDIKIILKNMQKNNYCSNEALYWYRDEFIAMKWSYFDKNDISIFSVDANPNDCPVFKANGYTTSNASATSNVFLLNVVKSEFSAGDIVIFGDSKKEYKIGKVKSVKRTETENFQEITLFEGLGFETLLGTKVTVVR
tara:strand:- start:2555 stop:3217 length:663 start_codon:yes stop_codon:yes gene_type:complete